MKCLECKYYKDNWSKEWIKKGKVSGYKANCLHDYIPAVCDMFHVSEGEGNADPIPVAEIIYIVSRDGDVSVVSCHKTLEGAIQAVRDENPEELERVADISDVQDRLNNESSTDNIVPLYEKDDVWFDVQMIELKDVWFDVQMIELKE